MALILTFLRLRLLPGLGSAFGWLFADWHRIAAVIVLAAIVAAYVVGDQRRAAADSAITQQKLDAQAKAFVTSADAAMAAEHQRQLQIGQQLTDDFQKQQAARDAADAKTDAALNKEIADAHQNLAAANNACALTDDDLGVLRNGARKAKP